MTNGSKDAETESEPLMRFGRAPGALGVAGAIIGVIGVVFFQRDAAGWISPEQLLEYLAGAVLGFAAGWLTGLIGAMGWLGE